MSSKVERVTTASEVDEEEIAAARPGVLSGRFHRVVVRELGETPPDALAHHVGLEAMERPDPGSLGPGDVLVEVKAASVGWVDLLMTSGQYQHEAKTPYVPGLESAGIVAWCGPSVRHVATGDRVLVDGLLAGPRSLGAYRDGGFASFQVVPGNAARPIPGTLSFDQACNLLGSYETAWHALVARARVAAGEVVLIHGAAGATGLAAVHVCKRLGAIVIATGRSAEKLAVVRAQGADHTIALRTGDDGKLLPFRDEVKALTGGRGVDVVHDGVGGDISSESLRCLRFGGRFLVVGWAATPFVARGRGGRGAPNPNQLPTNLILMKGLDVLGSPMAIATAVDPAIRAPRVAQILAWAEAGEIAPYVSRGWPLASWREAMLARWNAECVGGLVIRP